MIFLSGVIIMLVVGVWHKKRQYDWQFYKAHGKKAWDDWLTDFLAVVGVALLFWSTALMMIRHLP